VSSRTSPQSRPQRNQPKNGDLNTPGTVPGLDCDAARISEETDAALRTSSLQHHWQVYRVFHTIPQPGGTATTPGERRITQKHPSDVGLTTSWAGMSAAGALSSPPTEFRRRMICMGGTSSASLLPAACWRWSQKPAGASPAFQFVHHDAGPTAGRQNLITVTTTANRLTRHRKPPAEVCILFFQPQETVSRAY